MVLGCRGGLILGGAQQWSDETFVKQKRLEGLYTEDESKTLRKSHLNPFVNALYDEFLHYPNSHKSHEYLHTHYVKRGEFNELTDERYSVKADKLANTNKGESKVIYQKAREQIEPHNIMALKAENARLKKEYEEAMETVEIFKQIIADYI